LDLAGLRKLSPGFEWDTYLASSGYPGLTQIVVGQPEFFEGLSTQAAKADAETLRAYLRWHLLHSQAAFLSKAFVEEDFQFYGATLSGQKEDRPRWKKCVEATDGAMGESLGRYFVERAFPGDSKTIGLDLIGRIEAAFRANLDKLAWMDPATRKRAQEKLQALTNKIGYPDAWRDYSALKVVRNDYYANATAAETFEFKRVMDKVGKPVDRKEWGMSPPAVNAYYNPLNNEMVFPAGIMQPPFFKNDYPAAMNFGGIGLVMGHELTHGYDDQGRKFDPKGRLAEWWDPSAGEKFEKQAACVEDLYSSFEPQPGVHVNGKLTLGENIADFGGIKAAYQAWKSWEADKRTPAGAVEGLTNDQLFFVGFAQAWCAKMTPEMQRLLINLDPHSPDKYRVNGPLSNFSVFGEAFSCKVGDPMRPQKVCTVW
jgi:endothelin-converting enzyme/putative endopeptidase